MVETFLYFVYILNKITITIDNRSTLLHNLFLLDMSIFNELVIKSDPVKKRASFFVFMEGVQLPHDQVLVLVNRAFHCKVLTRLYHSSIFDILANLIFANFIKKTLFCQLHKNFRVS